MRQEALRGVDDALVDRARVPGQKALRLLAIANQAEVGAGTLYRPFPTREDLLLAVYRAEIDALRDAVAQTLRDSGPLDAFRIWARRLAALVRTKHGLGKALASPSVQAIIDETYGPVTSAIVQLLEAGVARGEVREGIEPADVLPLLSGLWRVPRSEAGLEQADHLLESVVGSLRP